MKSDDLGKLILRLSVGGLMIFHGIFKLIHGIGPVRAMLTDAHLPGFIAPGVFLGECIGPLLLIVGYKARLGALLEIFVMLMAMYLAFGSEVFTLNRGGGWVVELNMLYLLGSLAILFLGSGKFSISGGKGAWD